MPSDPHKPTGKELSDAIAASNSITYKGAFDTGHYHGRKALRREMVEAIAALTDEQVLAYSELAMADGDSLPPHAQYLRAVVSMVVNNIPSSHDPDAITTGHWHRPPAGNRKRD